MAQNKYIKAFGWGAIKRVFRVDERIAESGVDGAAGNSFRKIAMRNYKINYRGLFGQGRLLYLMLGAILAVGVLFRVAGFDTHVTYIDELICLTGGEWNSHEKESSYSYQSPWDYAKKMALSDGVTYAPLQFLLTYYFVKPHRPLLSPEALAASRIPSVIFGCLSIILLFLLFYRLSGDRLSYSLLLPLTLLAVSRINIVNSQQNHTYMIGVLAFIAVMLALTYLYESRKISVWAGAAALLCILTFSNYQLVPIVVLAIMLALCAVWLNTLRSRGDRKTAWLKTAFLIPSLGISLFFLRWVMEHKLSGSIPWWTADYSFELSGKGFFGKLSGLIKNVYFVLESLFLSGHFQTFNLISVAAAALIVSGGLAVLVYRRFRIEINILPLLLCFATFGLFFYLYFAQKIALSPSRHTLILAPGVLTVVFYCSFLIENSGMLNRNALGIYKGVLAGLSVLLLFGALMQYPDFYIKKTETFQPQKLIELSEKHNLGTIMTDWYSYNKLYMFLAREIAENRIRLGTVGEEYEFPNAPFLMVGQNVEAFSPLYKAGYYEYGSFSRILYEHSPGYDFEPSPRINFYWPNRMLVYRVDPPRGGKKPLCTREDIDAPADATIFFLQNAWLRNQYLNMEKGLKSSPIDSVEWVSAQWGLMKISDSPVEHYTIQNQRTGEYLYIDVHDGNRLKTGNPSDPPVERKYWVFEPVAGVRNEYRIRNLLVPNLYVNIESQVTGDPGFLHSVQATVQNDEWISPRWRLCDSNP